MPHQAAPRAPPTARAARLTLTGVVVCALALAGLAAATPTAHVAFDLPADLAEKSLRRFSRQAGVEVVFASGLAKGVHTQAVKGRMPARRALDAMLTGTGLVVFEDRTGAFSIQRDPSTARTSAPLPPDGNSPDRLKKNEPPAPSQTMKKNNLLARLTSGLVLAFQTMADAQVAPNAASPGTPPPARADVAIELSPFVVSEDSDAGWLATSTLAGSRLNTPLRDTGASIAVMTSEFLKDLGAIDLEDAVGYAVNMHLDTGEGTNTNDNWAMFNYDASRVKIRGVEATVTRNYFRWGLQSDSYNADRIEENRGPNSILFGIGSAGGVLNTLTKRANLSRNSRSASLMVGSYDTFRGTVDVNQRALNGKLAMRVNAVCSEMGNYRHHAFNDTQRIHLASTWQAREATQFRADYEVGRIQSVGVRPSPAFNGIANWVAAGSPIIATVQTGALATRAGVTQYAAGTRRLTFVENLGTVFNYQGLNRATGNSDVILDRSVADYSVNPAGPYNERDADFQALTVIWEQRFGRHTFAELSHNLQIVDRETFVAGQGRSENGTMYADPNQFLPNGQPNPYVGAFMFEGGRWNKSTQYQKSHNTRLMLSHERDFGRWGNYRLAAMAEHEWRSDINRNWAEVWDGRPFNSQPENDANQVWRRMYVTRGDWATYHSGKGPLNGLLQNVPDPTTPGRLLNSTWVPFNQNGQREPVERQDTVLAGGHARYFAGRLILGVGVRKDKLKVQTASAVRDPATQFWTVDRASAVRTEENFAGTTRTLGVVAHPTRMISLFYNFSNSINVPNTQHRILPDGRIPSNSEARGNDFGLRFTFFDGRLSARISHYTVDMIGATGGGFSGTADNPTVLNDRVLNALVAAGAISTQEADARDFITNEATIDRKLEGYEFNLTGALTKNWRLSANYSYSDGYDSNIAPEVKVWAAEALPWYRKWPNVMTAVAGTDGQLMTVGQLVTMWEADVQRLRWVREGDLILGNRKHKYSFFTRYGFDRGALKGLAGGGGYHFQSKAPIGFDASSRLLYSKAQGEADAFLSYRIRVPRGFLKNGVNLQLNIKNLFNETEPRITTLAADGVRVSKALVVAPRSWRLSANFDF